MVIPSFAVGRTQELLYFIREIKDQGLVTSVPNFPVYVDSPLAKSATTIFCGDLRGYLDEDALELVKDGTHMFNFPGLHLTETVDESKSLNEDHTPKVIISASGMCDAGRIRHHLKYNLWRADSAVVFVGFQSPGTLGRTLLDGATSVKLFGEDVAVRAKVVNFQGLSSHADHDHLLDWISHFKEPLPQHVFVVHGDREVAPVFAQAVSQLGFTAHAPQYTEEYDLLTCTQLAAGYLPQRKTRTFDGAPGSPQRIRSWCSWAIPWWALSAAARAGTTRPWPPLPRPCARSWRSSRFNQVSETFQGRTALSAPNFRMIRTRGGRLCPDWRKTAFTAPISTAIPARAWALPG